VKTAVSIPDEIFEAAEHVARRLGLSRSELYARALGEYLRAHRAEGVTKALDSVYAKEDSELDDVLAELQARSLRRERW
jgi:metal-responsive CopG/Arc/MetJ family transcriptional regulator